VKCGCVRWHPSSEGSSLCTNYSLWRKPRRAEVAAPIPAERKLRPSGEWDPNNFRFWNKNDVSEIGLTILQELLKLFMCANTQMFMVKYGMGGALRPPRVSMGSSYSTTAMAERYQNLLPIVHLNFRRVGDHVHLSNDGSFLFLFLNRVCFIQDFYLSLPLFISSQDSYHPFASRNDYP
jgi:hypothetical protein